MQGHGGGGKRLVHAYAIRGALGANVGTNITVVSAGSQFA